MRTAIQFKLNQQLAMTQQLQHAIRLLQLSSLELELEIRSALELNPLLEQIESEEDGTQLIDLESSVFERTIEFSEPPSLSYHHDWNHYSATKNEQILQKSAEITLRQHLLWQMEFAHMSERAKTIATIIIDAISEDGYLIISLAEIQEHLNELWIQKVEIEEIESVLQQIQQFEPCGIGARSLSECLNIQLHAFSKHSNYLPKAKQLVAEHLEALGKRDYRKIKAEMNLDEASLKAIIKILTSLNPRPGTEISCKKSEYIIPDVFACKQHNRLMIELNKECLPKLQLNSNYAAWIQRAGKQENSQMFKQQLKEAKWFLKSLQARDETLLKVSRAIMERQLGFLDLGEEAMQALNLQDIAQVVGLHESTVSRITSQKYILTPRGIFELKYFFSNPIASSTGRSSISATAIRALIKKFILEESSQTPLSDHKITELLSEQGIHIARRTVTKYREAMRIPTSNERKDLSFN